jgi:hypothetical protein
VEDVEEAQYEVFCKPKVGMDGPNFRGTMCVWRSGRAVVTCACRDCVNTFGEHASARNAILVWALRRFIERFSSRFTVALFRSSTYISSTLTLI